MYEEVKTIKPLFLSEEEVMAILDLCLMSPAELDDVKERVVRKVTDLARSYLRGSASQVGHIHSTNGPNAPAASAAGQDAATDRSTELHSGVSPAPPGAMLIDGTPIDRKLIDRTLIGRTVMDRTVMDKTVMDRIGGPGTLTRQHGCRTLWRPVGPIVIRRIRYLEPA